METVKRCLPVIERIHGSLWCSKHHMISAFATSFFKKKLPTDVFTERISASIALVVQLQSLAIPPNNITFAAVEEQPTFVSLEKYSSCLGNTLQIFHSSLMFLTLDMSSGRPLPRVACGELLAVHSAVSIVWHGPNPTCICGDFCICTVSIEGAVL